MLAAARRYIIWHLSDNKKRSVLGRLGRTCDYLSVISIQGTVLGVKVAWTLIKMLTSIICVSFSRLVWTTEP